MAGAEAVIVIVKGGNDIVFVGHQRIAHLHLGAELHVAHLPLLECPVGRLGALDHGDGQRVNEALIVAQIQHLVVRAIVDVLAYADGECLLLLRLQSALGALVDGYPRGQALDGVALVGAALIADIHGEHIVLVRTAGYLHALLGLRPAHHVTVDEC